MDTQKLIEQLNDNDMQVRLNALAEIKKLTDEGVLPAVPDTLYVNNHIHTTYSFSPRKNFNIVIARPNANGFIKKIAIRKLT